MKTSWHITWVTLLNIIVSFYETNRGITFRQLWIWPVRFTALQDGYFNNFVGICLFKNKIKNKKYKEPYLTTLNKNRENSFKQKGRSLLLWPHSKYETTLVNPNKGLWSGGWWRVWNSAKSHQLTSWWQKRHFKSNASWQSTNCWQTAPQLANQRRSNNSKDTQKE